MILLPEILNEYSVWYILYEEFLTFKIFNFGILLVSSLKMLLKKLHHHILIPNLLHLSFTFIQMLEVQHMQHKIWGRNTKFQLCTTKNAIWGGTVIKFRLLIYNFSERAFKVYIYCTYHKCVQIHLKSHMYVQSTMLYQLKSCLGIFVHPACTTHE